MQWGVKGHVGVIQPSKNTWIGKANGAYATAMSVFLSMCLSIFSNVVQKLLLAACLVKAIQCAKVHLISSLRQNMVTSMI